MTPDATLDLNRETLLAGSAGVAAQTPTAPSDPSPVCDFLIEFKTQWRRAILPFLIVVGLVALVPVALIGLNSLGISAFRGAWGGGTFGGIFGGLAGGVGVHLLMRSLVFRARRDFAKLVAAEPQPHTADALLRIAQTIGQRYGYWGFSAIGKRNLAVQLVERLAACVAPGQPRIFRIAPNADMLRPLEPPFDTPFEPTPINDTRESFAETRGGALTSWQRIAVVWRTMMQAVGKRRWVRTAFLLLMGFGWLVLGAIVLDGIRQAILGRVSSGLFLAASLIAIVGFAAVWQLIRRDTWFAVPRGVIIADGSMWGAKSSGRHVNREDAVLLYIAPLASIAVATTDGYSAIRALTPFEVDFLLRAWRSPAQPPDARMVAGFLETMA
ncbi:MAG: hypothetical protein SF069_07045 [Phycisphaerae bacterium]|nr:hypothetical protein [Phycisphaerae bacterium]